MTRKGILLKNRKMKINPQLIVIKIVIPIYRTIHVNDFIVITDNGYFSSNRENYVISVCF